MAIDPKSLTIDTRQLLSLTSQNYQAYQERYSKRPYIETLLSALTPSQFAELFPDAYLRKIDPRIQNRSLESLQAALSGGVETTGQTASTTASKVSGEIEQGQGGTSSRQKPESSSVLKQSWDQSFIETKQVAPNTAALTTGGHPVLAQARAKAFAELESKPELKATVLSLVSKHENDQDPAGPLEALANRSAMTGKSIEELINNGFYGPINKGKVQPLDPIAEKGLLKKATEAYEKVRGGSNTIELRTDQGKINEHKWADENPTIGGKQKFNGEWYSFMGPEGVKWAKQIEQKMKEYDDQKAKFANETEKKDTQTLDTSVVINQLDEKMKTAYNDLKDQQKTLVDQTIKEYLKEGKTPAEVKEIVSSFYEKSQQKETAIPFSTDQLGEIKTGKNEKFKTVSTPADDWLFSRFDINKKDHISAERYGMDLKDYVIRGMDPRFRKSLYEIGQKYEKETGKKFQINSGFRDDYRQSLASGFHADPGMSRHGGSQSIGGDKSLGPMAAYSRGQAADLPAHIADWVAKQGTESGMVRSMPKADPYHVTSIFAKGSKETSGFNISEDLRNKKNEEFKNWMEASVEQQKKILEEQKKLAETTATATPVEAEKTIPKNVPDSEKNADVKVEADKKQTNVETPKKTDQPEQPKIPEAATGQSRQSPTGEPLVVKDSVTDKPLFTMQNEEAKNLKYVRGVAETKPDRINTSFTSEQPSQKTNETVSDKKEHVVDNSTALKEFARELNNLKNRETTHHMNQEFPNYHKQFEIASPSAYDAYKRITKNKDDNPLTIPGRYLGTIA